MSTWFLHSILKYRHNQAVEEELNIGVLFYFPAEGHLHLAHPKKLNRLKHTYPAFKTKDIRAYLNSFAAKAKKLEKQNFMVWYHGMVWDGMGWWGGEGKEGERVVSRLSQESISFTQDGMSRVTNEL